MKNKNIQKIFSVFALVIFLLLLTISVRSHVSYAQTSQQFSKEELAQILAPIALYPDVLLSQILIASSYPYEVAEADRWMANNPYLEDEALDEALSQKDWDVSVLSLCHYPKVLSMMSENLNWTAKVGDAFVNQELDVLDTIQELRTRASAQGNLATTDEQRVIVEERIIRIEPVYYNYLYVPVYDPLVIYGPWWYPAFPPYPIYYPGIAVAGPRIVFAPRLFLGFGVIGWSLFDWHTHNVVIVNLDHTRRFYKHARIYHRPERFQWRLDQERRAFHKTPRRQVSHSYPSAKLPREVPPGGFKRGADVVVSPRDKVGYEGPRAIDKDKRPSLTPKDKGKGGALAIGESRVIDKDKHPERPKGIDQGKRPDSTPIVTNKKGSTPYTGGTRIINRDKAQPQLQPTASQTQPKQPAQFRPQLKQQPQVKSQSKPLQSQPRVINKNGPAVQNRGPAGTVKTPQTMPRVENRAVNKPARDAQQGKIDNQRDFSGEVRGGSDKGNEHGIGGSREGRK